MSELEPSQMRISDADRNQVAEILREAAGDGRIDLAELDERLEATYAAKTYAELVPITRDLAPAVARQAAVTKGVERERAVAIMGGVERRGAWTVPEQFSLFCFWGGAELDLRQARFTTRETVIRAFGIWSGIDIYVNAYTRVIVDGVGIMGAFDQARDKVQPELGPDSPLVRVTGFALMAGVTVQRRPMPGQRRRRRGMLGH